MAVPEQSSFILKSGRSGIGQPSRYRPKSAAVPLGQDLGLLALELIGGDGPAVAQVGQLGQLVG